MLVGQPLAPSKTVTPPLLGGRGSTVKLWSAVAPRGTESGGPGGSLRRAAAASVQRLVRFAPNRHVYGPRPGFGPKGRSSSRHVYEARMARGGPAADALAITSVHHPSGQAAFHNSPARGCVPMRSAQTPNCRHGGSS